MKINESLNLVIPVVSDDKGPVIRAYHSPISKEVFEANYRILAAAKSAMTGKGLHYVMDAGPRIAALTLRDEAYKDAAERGDVDDTEKPSTNATRAFFLELKRLTVILSPTSSGFDALPVDSAISQGIIDADDWSEAESAIVFFTCHYALASKKNKPGIANATASVLQGLMTSSSVTEFADSLRNSTPAATSPAPVASSLPS